MMMAWYFLQTIIVFGLLGWGAYAAMNKIKKGQFNRTGKSGKMEVIDGLKLNNQTSAYLLNVENQRLFVVVGEGSINTITLKDQNFQHLMKENLDEVVSNEE